ncbi:MAG TPA: ABC transporter ATP-binding protein [Candidatus Methanofastidiosa archaeon]|nr:ABC transporter ATP-binding protein [Candidatus Methanofastidiosa archaeon]HPR41650.1 ABC transporter ATP-binding protein [Candidatus Methanofastidiosa archaeon]
MVTVDLEGITKKFKDVVAVNNVSLKIEDGELFTLLGPSGCGKTTVLRCIAGFYIPEAGNIIFDNLDVTNVPPNLRETGMVFQNYALWPHMSIFDNVAYGLKIRKMEKGQIEEKVNDILKLVKLKGFSERYPYQLSGGQQQRVALARALVIEPKVLLLDEPLSNLDAKLRIEMRNEISRIQKRLDITTIYVTHDQEEALAISDRLTVMDKGVIQQIGTPVDIYSRPNNYFVADFIGECNLIKGKIIDIGKYIEVETEIGNIKGVYDENNGRLKVGDDAYAAIRPEHFELQRATEDDNHVKGKVKYSQYFGKINRLFIDANGNKIMADADPLKTHGIDKREIDLFAEPESTLILPKD